MLENPPHIEVILDKSQYDDCLLPIGRFAESIGCKVTYSRFNSRAFDADIHFLLQDFGLISCPGFKVFVPHGLSLLKAFDFAFKADAVVVPSVELNDALNWSMDADAVAIAGVGYPKIDHLLVENCRLRYHRDAVRSAMNFDDRPIVTCFPSWKDSANLIHKQRDYSLLELKNLLNEHFNVVVIPHQLDQELQELNDLGIVPVTIERLSFIIGSDVIITDNSGIGFECAAIDKPMVLLGNRNDADFFVDIVSGSGRKIDYGPVASLDTVLDCVKKVLANPSWYSEQRLYWASRVMGPLDGGSSGRILSEALKLQQCHSKSKAQYGLSNFLELGNMVALFKFFGCHHKISRPKPNCIVLDVDPNKNRVIFYGPYIGLPPGNYALDLSISLPRSECVELKLRINGKIEDIFISSFKGNFDGILRFVVPDIEIFDKSIEFVLDCGGSKPFTLIVYRFVLLKAGNYDEKI
ncbi:CDP-glycerol glycerophosphotransferase family protein [Sphingobium sp. HT1-2]|uniref:CDP-glycerol glycerophosphotransferase family protein n=1 Tax=Sphingobium sp. HT1-2 TaxID=3111640 RepID=UPI003C06C44D